MKTIEDGLYLHDGILYGPLAERALRRADEASGRFDHVQQDPAARTDAQLIDEVRRALRHFMQREPQSCQVFSLARQIRQGTECAWPMTDRLPLA